MIKILKQCPITVDGEDRVELLVQDTSVCLDPCSRCCYHGYVHDDDLEATCSDVHDCGSLSCAFFIIA